jgi:hypothetical protein
LSNSHFKVIDHRLAQGEVVWNAWRRMFTAIQSVPDWKNKADFSNYVNTLGDHLIDLSNFEFGDGANFEGSNWRSSVKFKGCKWGNYSNLSKVTWENHSNFLFSEWGECCNFNFSQWGSDTIFSQAKWGIFCTFIGSTWGDRCRFISSQWSKNCNFLGSSWGDDANFNGAKWGQSAYFVGAQWRGSAYFEGTQWGRDIDFSGAYWFGKVSFGGVNLITLRHLFQNQKQFDNAKDWSEQHGGESNIFFKMNFSGARFLEDVDFSNRQFKEGVFYGVLQSKPEKLTPLVNDAVERLRVERDLTTNLPIIENDGLVFEPDPDQRLHVVFGAAPKFHGCEIHQDTSFEGAEFPKPTGSEEAARAYRTLKLAFNKQQAIREEQRFFKLEMEEETLRETGLKRWLFKAYKTFSDYGFSITRPLTYGGLGVLWLTAAYGILSLLGQCGLSMQACHFAPEWLEFSLLHTLPLPGLDKLSEAASKKFWPEGSWWSFVLSILVILHKTLSLAALFLVGLALRNLFKLK